MDQNHQTFQQQALHYFDREQQEIRRTPLDTAAAWRGRDLSASDEWIVRLTSAQLAELETASNRTRERGLPLEALRRDDFPLPRLSAAIAEWRHELRDGRGFLLLRGVPVDRWTYEDTARAYWGLGLHLGRPGAQNPAGELLGHVADMQEEASQPFVRRYRTRGDIAYHCDLADVVGLLCWRTARSGGASRIVSSVSVYNELLHRRPDLIDRLYEPFHLDTRDEGNKLRYVPIPPCRYAHGVLRTFYHSDYFRSVVRHPDVPPFTAQEQELLDLYEAIASSPDLYLDMQFEPGDVQLISNHFILHGRTAYEDYEEPERRRHLLRLWLSLDQDSAP
jgi:hypothetical protein